jgi:hypothetical protein
MNSSAMKSLFEGLLNQHVDMEVYFRFDVLYLKIKNSNIVLASLSSPDDRDANRRLLLDSR